MHQEPESCFLPLHYEALHTCMGATVQALCNRCDLAQAVQQHKVRREELAEDSQWSNARQPDQSICRTPMEVTKWI